MRGVAAYRGSVCAMYSVRVSRAVRYVHMCICFGFVMYGCVYLWVFNVCVYLCILHCLVVCMCGFLMCLVWVF